MDETNILSSGTYEPSTEKWETGGGGGLVELAFKTKQMASKGGMDKRQATGDEKENM
mgnify:FL=1